MSSTNDNDDLNDFFDFGDPPDKSSPADKDSDMLTAALEYAELVMPVFPVKSCDMSAQSEGSRGKEPLTPHGHKDATTDPAKIREYWTSHPNANIGYAVPEGVIVLDVDGNQGIESLKEHGLDIPKTLTVETGRENGRHYYFRGHGRCRNGVLPGVDIKSNGGYVILPPSKHRTGRTYEFVGGRIETADAPDWLEGLCNAKPAALPVAVPKKTELKKDRGPVFEGGRNDYLFRRGAGMRGKDGLDEAELREALLDENQRVCNPPLSHSEVEKIAARASMYEDESSQSSSRNESVSDMLLRIGSSADLWHDSMEDCFATVEVQNTKRSVPIKSREFQLWLRNAYSAEIKRAGSRQGHALKEGVINSVVDQLEADARYNGPERTSHLRIAMVDDTLYVNLANDKQEVVEITKNGWQIINDPPVRFVRINTLTEMVRPKAGGTIEVLKQYVNVASETDFHLFLGSVLGSYHPTGPYPVLFLSGAQGSAKSTATELFRKLTDPSKLPHRNIPNSEEDLLIAAMKSHVLAFDNVSRISPSASDQLSRLATGSGIGKRLIYTPAEELILTACRQIVINGIGDLVKREDLRDRIIQIPLQKISDGEFKTTEHFWAQFDDDWAQIMGAIMNGLSSALRNRDKATAGPRMADFAAWAGAGGEAFDWPSGYFAELYQSHRNQTKLDSAVENEFAVHIANLCVPFEGTATELLNRIRTSFPVRTPVWVPKSPGALSGALTRATDSLKALGVSDERDRSGPSRRIILTRINDEKNDPASFASPLANVMREDNQVLSSIEDIDDEFEIYDDDDDDDDEMGMFL